mmetsp:Transcript_64294/g.119486  ORF Transcript_64294/g.119486 Transcript_64294/m.119486 type:complete len:137 (+) Transcript_64294:62-472(+)
MQVSSRCWRLAACLPRHIPLSGVAELRGGRVDQLHAQAPSIGSLMLNQHHGDVQQVLPIEVILPPPSSATNIITDPRIGNCLPQVCKQHWLRIIKNQKGALRGVENASKADCGPRKRHWKWYRDMRIKMRHKRRCI